jgi:hypothetical protein
VNGGTHLTSDSITHKKMHTEIQQRMKQIQSRLDAGRASLSELKSQLADNDDECVKGVLQELSNKFSDVKDFLAPLKHERMPPRNLSDESTILDRAEFWLERIALAQLKALQDMVAKFGPGVQMATQGEDRISTN